MHALEKKTETGVCSHLLKLVFSHPSTWPFDELEVRHQKAVVSLYTSIRCSDLLSTTSGSHTPRVGTWSRLFAGDSIGEVRSPPGQFRPHHGRYCPPLSGDNHGWVVSAVRTGCALGHRATTIRACAHLMKTAARYQLRAQGRSFVPGPNKFGGITGRSPGERPHYGIAGKVPLAGESPGKRDLMWTQGMIGIGGGGHIGDDPHQGNPPPW